MLVLAGFLDINFDTCLVSIHSFRASSVFPNCHCNLNRDTSTNCTVPSLYLKPTPGASAPESHYSFVCPGIGFGANIQKPVREWKAVWQLGMGMAIILLKGTSPQIPEYEMESQRQKLIDVLVTLASGLLAS